MEKKRRKRILAVLLLFTILLTAVIGCDSSGLTGNGESTKKEDSQSTDTGRENMQQPEDGTAMGRYVENVTDLSDRINGWQGGGLYRLSDGSLVITDAYKPFIVSKDNGVTWGDDSRPWHDQMRENDTYIMSMAVGPDNTMGVIYQDDTEDNETEEEKVTLNSRLLVVKPDGTKVTLDPEITEEDNFIWQVYISDTGRIFVSTVGSGNIYEIKEDGSSEKVLTLDDGRPDLIQFQGNLAVLDGYGYKQPLIYDMEKGEYLEDEVLGEFVNTNYKNRDSMGGIWHDMYFFFGEENVLYLAGAKGLYRHVIGGNAIEQVIDGSLCIFNNPAYQIVGMTALDNNEFMALFGGGSVVRFTYDPDIPTVPNEKLKVYSLKENDTIRQAITWYQTANPAIFVEYEVGTAEGSVTKEDALKNLNTRIMAGEGPDVLILDDMPLNSYIDKGALLDLSSVLENLDETEGLFDNIVEAFRKENKIYAVPCEIQMPVILTAEKYASRATDLKGIADMTEELRQDHPGKDLLGICTEKGIMRLFAMVCVPEWISEEGKINKESIEEFLVQTKRIYDAQMDGIPEKTVEEYISLNDEYLQQMGVSRDDSQYLRSYVSTMDYIGELSYMACGTLVDPYSYASLTSVGKKEQFEESRWIPMNGQSDHVFCAQTLLGISAASKNIPQAEEFVKVCLGEDNQSNLFKGFAVNKTAFEKKFIINEEEVDENGIYGSAASGNGDGFYVTLDIYWPDSDQIAQLRNCIEQADTPYIKDDVLEEAVYTEGIAYIQGLQSLEEAIDAIEKKISIYMAE